MTFENYFFLKYTYYYYIYKNYNINALSSDILNFMNFFNFITICRNEKKYKNNLFWYYYSYLNDYIHIIEGYIYQIIGNDKVLYLDINKIPEVENLKLHASKTNILDKYFIIDTIEEFNNILHKWITIKLVYHLNLSNKTKKTLEYLNLHTLNDVISADDQEIQNLRSVGGLTLKQIDIFKKIIIDMDTIMMLSFNDKEIPTYIYNDSYFFKFFINTNYFMPITSKNYLLSLADIDFQKFITHHSSKLNLQIKKMQKASVNLFNKMPKNADKKFYVNQEDMPHNWLTYIKKITKDYITYDLEIDLSNFFFISDKSKKVLNTLKVRKLDDIGKLQDLDITKTISSTKGAGKRTAEEIVYLRDNIRSIVSDRINIPETNNINLKYICENINLYLNTLDEESKQILLLRYERQLTLEQVGIQIRNMSRERIRQLLARELLNLYYFIKMDVDFYIAQSLDQKGHVLLKIKKELFKNILKEILLIYYNLNEIYVNIFIRKSKELFDDYCEKIIKKVFTIGIPVNKNELFNYMLAENIPFLVFHLFQKKYKVKIIQNEIKWIGKATHDEKLELILRRKNMSYHYSELTKIFIELSREDIDKNHVETRLTANPNCLLISKGTFVLKDYLFKDIGYENIQYILNKCYNFIKNLENTTDALYLINEIDFNEINYTLNPYILKSILLTDDRFASGRKFEVRLKEWDVKERIEYTHFIEEVLKKYNKPLKIDIIQNTIKNLYNRLISTITIECILNDNQNFIRVEPKTYALLEILHLSTDDIRIIREFTNNLLQENMPLISLNFVYEKIIKYYSVYNTLTIYTIKHILKKDSDIIFFEKNIIAHKSIIDSNCLNLSDFIVAELKNINKPILKSIFTERILKILKDDNLQTYLNNLYGMNSRIKTIGHFIMHKDCKFNHNEIDIGLNIEI